ncbi:pheophorbide a oxygenase, chloroplastic [Curcuma longa]|uniref:pheophorbide a oxygenase, chloroplastic n=1 Tax=Curcuma longa TaxID=136217 RepID=UPI003D9E80D7
MKFANRMASLFSFASCNFTSLVRGPSLSPSSTISSAYKPSSVRRRGCSRRSPPRLLVATPSSPVAPTPAVDDNHDAEEASSSAQSEPAFSWRDHWYPVSLIEDLDPRVPTPFQLLNRDLVIWKDPNSGSWVALDDRCPHRLAPLSEGRIDESGCLQCSYHGWSFDGSGACSRIPQAASEGPEARAVRSPRACAIKFPTLVSQGLLFVWPDEKGWEKATATQPPMLPAEFDDPNFSTVTIQRDLFYGYDTLMENVSDPSHIEFAHHKLLLLPPDCFLGCQKRCVLTLRNRKTSSSKICINLDPLSTRGNSNLKSSSFALRDEFKSSRKSNSCLRLRILSKLRCSLHRSGSISSASIGFNPGLIQPQSTAAFLKHPRTPASAPAVDYQTADSEHLVKRLRTGQSDEETSPGIQSLPFCTRCALLLSTSSKRNNPMNEVVMSPPNPYAHVSSAGHVGCGFNPGANEESATEAESRMKSAIEAESEMKLVTKAKFGMRSTFEAKSRMKSASEAESRMRIEINTKLPVLGDQNWVIWICSFNIPMAPGKTRSIVCSARNFFQFTMPGPSWWQLVPRWYEHWTSNKVYDGDMIVLQGQEKIFLSEMSASSKDVNQQYTKITFTPTQADRLVLAFRNWLRRHGNGQPDWFGHANQHALPSTVLSKREMLDRYEQHTLKCSSCKGAFEAFQFWQKLFVASTVIFCAVAGIPSEISFRLLLAGAAIASAALAYALNQHQKNFVFVDYVHAKID